MYRNLTFCFLAAVLAFIIAPAHAGVLGFDIVGGGAFGCDTSAAPGCIGGYQFHTDSAVFVEALGIWDEGADGLVHNHDVALWTLEGSLLASATVTNLSAVVPSVTVGGQWLFTSITPILLPAGDYILAAFYPGVEGGGDPARALSTASSNSGLTFVEARDEVFIGSLEFPTISLPQYNDAFFGPNLLVSQVPEPSTLLLLAPLAGLALVRRRAISRAASTLR